MSIAGRVAAWSRGTLDGITRFVDRARLKGWRRELIRLVFESHSLIPLFVAVVLLTLAIETPIACVVLACL